MCRWAPITKRATEITLVGTLPLTRGSCSHIGRDIPRTNSVDLHVVLAPLVTQGFCELPEGALGRGVGRNCDTTLEGEEGTKVYDLSLPSWHHVTACCLRKEPDGLEVDVQHLKVSN